MRHARGKWYWADRSYPAENVSLRTSTPENVVIVDTTRGRDEVIGEMDMPSAKLLVFDHAIYIHRGDQFAVQRLDLENRRCFVEEADTDYWTDSIVKTDIKVLTEDEEASTAGIRTVLGDILVRTQATKFKKLKYHTNENVGYGDITLPPDEMHTRSAVLLLDEATAPGRSFRGLSEAEQGIVIQRLGVLLRTVAPVFLLCDPRDLGVSERVRDPHFEAPCLFVFDQYPGRDRAGRGVPEEPARRSCRGPPRRCAPAPAPMAAPRASGRRKRQEGTVARKRSCQRVPRVMERGSAGEVRPMDTASDPRFPRLGAGKRSTSTGAGCTFPVSASSPGRPPSPPRRAPPKSWCSTTRKPPAFRAGRGA